MTDDLSLSKAFTGYSAAKLKQYCERIEVCLAKLDQEQLWGRGHATENSIGNLCLHLSGNARQWILSAIGGAEDVRQRDAEFSAAEGRSAAELSATLRDTVASACEVIEELTPGRLGEPVTVQGYGVTILQAVYHVVEHFSHHTGQILFATKALTGQDLGFYSYLSGPERGDHVP